MAEAAYFHRELPYDAGRVERITHGCATPGRWWTAGAVTLDADGATVRVADRVHRVRLVRRGRRRLHLPVVGRVPRQPRHVQARARGRADPAGETADDDLADEPLSRAGRP